LPDDWRAWAIENRSDLDPDAVFDHFRDHWIAQAGQRGVKADWFATWRNWIRKERSNGFNGNGGRGQTGRGNAGATRFDAVLAGARAALD